MKYEVHKLNDERFAPVGSNARFILATLQSIIYANQGMMELCPGEKIQERESIIRDCVLAARIYTSLLESRPDVRRIEAVPVRNDLEGRFLKGTFPVQIEGSFSLSYVCSLAVETGFDHRNYV